MIHSLVSIPTNSIMLFIAPVTESAAAIKGGSSVCEPIIAVFVPAKNRKSRV